MKYGRTGNRIRNNSVPVARSGYPFILVSAAAAAGFAVLGWGIPAALGGAATLFVVFFFRDPDRPIPEAADAIVAPADGRVVSIETVSESPFFSAPCRRIGIFMTVFDVHVNRIPYGGRIEAIRYHAGAFLAANQDRASEINERNAVLVETDNGKRISVVQVAGLIARRIVCAVRENDAVTRGERFGLIRFGSRVDVYLPEATPIRVRPGERVRAGVSVIGYLR